MYRVEFRTELNLLDIEWLAPFTPDQVAVYASELRAQFDRSGFQPGYRLRMDMRKSAVQTQDSVRAFNRCFAGFPLASRIAVITDSALLRIQVKRVMTQPYMRVFERPEAGLGWLLGREKAMAIEARAC